MDCCPETVEKRLPADFADRLIARIRARRRRERRAKVLAAIAVLIVGALACVGFWEPEPAKVATEAQLVAAHPTNRQEQVSGWMLLGVFRECFKRMKTSKKKEEE